MFSICVLLIFCFGGALSKKPHIIFIVADDLGWNDVSFHGSLQIPTPNIDALARDGLILNNYYVQPICTPSRGALMTGKYPLRLGLQHDVIYSEAPWGLSPEEKILPQYLKDLGYKTYGIGKWHLGFFHESYLPLNRGFDSFFGYWSGKGDHFTHYDEGQGSNGLDLHDGNENVWNYTGIYSTDVFTDQAKGVLQRHNHSQPLFLYLAYQAVHAGNSYSPLQAPTKYIERFAHITDEERRCFAGMTSALDDAIGELFKTLNTSGILKDCLIVFTTDNGAAVQGIDQSSGSNWPLRGSKYNLWEGGIRGVAFVWSEAIRSLQQKVSSQLMHISDWLPTLFSAAGGDLKHLPKLDGFNQWSAFFRNGTSPRNMILHNIDPVWYVESIRHNNYKLIKGSVFNGRFDGWFDKEGKKQDNLLLTQLELEIQVMLYKKLWAKSEVVSILSEVFGKNMTLDIGKDCLPNNRTNCSAGEESESTHNAPAWLEINCGERPLNTTFDCEPMQRACLFDIEKDPCEYYNMAEINPKVVQDLEAELDKYRSEAVDIRNQPPDPMANPKYHGYAWIPWVKTL